MQKYTILDFQRDFPDDDTCLEWLKNHLFPSGIFCKSCDRVTKHHRVQSRRSYSCDRCGHHVHPTASTVYHKSTTSLRLWFYAIYLMASTRCGISAKQLQRELGVTYKTAWRMGHELRKLMADANGNEPLAGHVEIDETLVGGRRKGGKRGRGAPGKTVVFGMLERKGRVRAGPVPNVERATLEPLIREHVEHGTIVSTDELGSYRRLSDAGYEHGTVRHGAGEYVNGIHHVNSLEGYWSQLKRSIRGTHVHVSRKHLWKYVSEFAFRYNRRNDDQHMFSTILSQVCRSGD